MIDINPENKSSLRNVKFIDLFAGIGGFHLALDSFGAECVFSSEWDKHASNVYYKNFGIEPKGDITLISEKDIPKHDILCGGFPCQAFSISGKQKGFEDTRGTLFFDILRIAAHHKPSILFLENVKNLLSHDNGKTLNTINLNLDLIGYNVYQCVLNSSNYGLPQNRERIYFVCFRKDLQINEFNFPPKVLDQISLSEIMEKKVDEKYFVDRTDIQMKPKSIIELKEYQNNNLNRPLQIGQVNKGGQGERIYSTKGHAITLSAYGGGPGGKTGLYFSDEKIRKLTERECARVQGFPENFIIHENKNQAYKQFGNSVAINVLQYILLEITKVIDFSDLNKKQNRHEQLGKI